MLKTYGEWQKLGYQVIKGQKAKVLKPLGKSLFHRNQVKSLAREYSDTYHPSITAQANALFNSVPYYVQQRVIDSEEFQFDDIGDR